MLPARQSHATLALIAPAGDAMFLATLAVLKMHRPTWTLRILDAVHAPLVVAVLLASPAQLMETEHFMCILTHHVALHVPIGLLATGLATVQMYAVVCRAQQLVV